MMNDLADFIHSEIQRHLAHMPGLKAAEISAYDPDRHAIKAMLRPDDIETGWFPMGTAHVGNGFGVVIGPSVGDQIMVGFLGNNINAPVHMGRLHSDKERPPKAKSGEVVIQDGNGNLIKISSSGISIHGNVDFSGGYVKANGHAIDDTHVHTNTQPGAGTSGVPQ